MFYRENGQFKTSYWADQQIFLIAQDRWAILALLVFAFVGVPLLVDATLTSPWLMKPLEHGADLVVHSATKFLSGHGTVVGGVLVDGGSFDWAGPNTHGKFEELTQAYDGFHNMIFNEESSVGAFLLRARREGLRDFGACMSPHTAWLILQGIETLPLRMARHISNTEKVDIRILTINIWNYYHCILILFWNFLHHFSGSASICIILNG